MGGTPLHLHATANTALALASAAILGVAHHHGQLAALRDTIAKVITQQTIDRTELEAELDALHGA
jgi:hypothetical protein